MKAEIRCAWSIVKRKQQEPAGEGIPLSMLRPPKYWKEGKYSLHFTQNKFQIEGSSMENVNLVFKHEMKIWANTGWCSSVD